MKHLTAFALLLSSILPAQIYPPPSTPPIYTTSGAMPHGSQLTFCINTQAGTAAFEAQDITLYHRDLTADALCGACPALQGAPDTLTVTTSNDDPTYVGEYPVLFLLRLTPMLWPGPQFACGSPLTLAAIPGAHPGNNITWYDPANPDYVAYVPEFELPGFAPIFPRTYYWHFVVNPAWLPNIASGYWFSLQTVRIDGSGELWFSDMHTILFRLI